LGGESTGGADGKAVGRGRCLGRRKRCPGPAGAGRARVAQAACAV